MGGFARSPRRIASRANCGNGLKKDLELKNSVDTHANIPEYWVSILSTKQIISF